MNEWLVRVVTKATFEPSGDHRGLLLVPHAVMNGFSPRSMSFAGGAWETRAR